MCVLCRQVLHQDNRALSIDSTKFFYALMVSVCVCANGQYVSANNVVIVVFVMMTIT